MMWVFGPQGGPRSPIRPSTKAVLPSEKPELALLLL